MDAQLLEPMPLVEPLRVVIRDLYVKVYVGNRGFLMRSCGIQHYFQCLGAHTPRTVRLQ